MRYLRSTITSTAEIFTRWFYNIIKSMLPDTSAREASFMARIAFQDFKNYLRSKLKLSRYEITEHSVVMEMENMLMESKRYDRELKEWTELWLQKWKERVKVVLSEEDVKKQKLVLDEEINSIVRNLGFWRELKDFVMGALIEKGEICFTDIISENILRIEVNNIFKKLGNVDSTIKYLQENPIHLLNRALDRVKMISSKRTPLVLVRINTKMIDYIY